VLIRSQERRLRVVHGEGLADVCEELRNPLELMACRAERPC
jgi:hypothetical protein